MNSQQQINFIKNLVSRRQDHTRIVSSLPIDKPGSSGSKLTVSALGVRFGFSQNATPSQTETQTNSSRSVLGVFVQLRGVLQPATLVAVDDDLANSFLLHEKQSSSARQLLSTLSWFFCPTNENIRQHEFWVNEVDQTCDFQDATKHHLPYSLCYTGVQFGVPAQQLGDGRIVTLCETTTETISENSNTSLVELQIKGGGIRTPYSRGLDGLLTLQSALKEFLLSKTLRSLDIPVAACVAVFKENGRECFRDSGTAININQGRGSVNERNKGFVVDDDDENDDDYEEEGKQDNSNNNNSSSSSHSCGVLLRMTSCPIRIGTFEYLVKTRQWKLMSKLIQYLFQVHFSNPNSEGRNGNNDNQQDLFGIILKLLKQITIRLSSLVAKWQVNGFVHGALNTDNISIIGETLDLATGCLIHYFDDDFVQNPDDIDNAGMYRFGRQPQKIFEACERLGFLFLSFYQQLPREEKNAVNDLRQAISQTVSENFQETLTKVLNQELCFNKLGLDVEKVNEDIIKQLSSLIFNVLRKQKPELDLFYEKIWNLIRNPSHRSRSDENDDEDENESKLIAFLKIHRNDLKLSSSSSCYKRREIPSNVEDIFQTCGIVDDNDNQHEIVKLALQKAFASAFPKIHKSFEDNQKNKLKRTVDDDCGCG